ncbi:ATP-binding/permease protein CydD [Roseibaca ekhonensis]|uniref:ATP-binding/permease protein CydD n=1 Tax=Roseinatronobacter ekhonensis TaxID=254356 RepID=A0A3B0M749_9RHOB|nr:thiol reductant ABC exporter subunit CydD [Roseibaca ekhonensis]SUZ31240.1 ATP-binding/permease protein CydD [Roseibaca ekhonensis]
MVRAEARAIQHASLISAVSAVLWPAQAALVALAISRMLTAPDSGIVPLIAGFVALGLIRAALSAMADRNLQASARAVVAGARETLVRSEAARAGDTRFGGAGAIAALGSTKLDLLIPYITRYQPARLRTALVPLVILALSFWQAWVVAAVLLVAGPLIPVFMALVGWAAKEASARQLAEIGTLNDTLVERLSALADIRVLGAQSQVLDGFAARAEDLRRRTMRVLAVAFLSSTVLELFSALGVAMVAVFVGFSLLDIVTFGTWGAKLDPAAGVFLLLLAPDFFQPLRDLSAAWHDKAAAEAVAEEYHDWSQTGAAARLGAGMAAMPLSGPPEMTVTDARLPSGVSLPDLHIRPGERVALIGPSGAGKTTLLRVLAGLVQLPGAQVRVAGQTLDDSTADAWRARLGWMPQAPHFLNASLRRNIDMGQADAAATARALDRAAIGPVVAALPQGLNTRLGETGAGLSGGEGRRITFARAVHGAPDVILADEPTADLDPDTAAQITKALLAEGARGATLVIATHDQTLAARMDRVIELRRAE